MFNIHKSFVPKFRDHLLRVIYSLSKTNIEFFKKQATIYHTQYQKMIRRLLDEYLTIQKRLLKSKFHALHAELKKILKIEMDKSTWKEFGIQDKM